MAANKQAVSPGIMLVVSFFVLFIVNAAVIMLANALFPTNIVLGTLHIPLIWAVIHSACTLALINAFAIPFINQAEAKQDKPYTPAQWMGFYFTINFVGLWGIARFSDQLGLGISSWVVVALLALALDAAQGIAMMQLEKARTT